MEHRPSPTISTILVIDDSPEDRDIFRQFLQQDATSTYQILEAESGEQGLQLLGQLLPQSSCDLILLDFYLPDRDGIELLNLIKQRAPATLPILILTGPEDEKTADQAMKCGAQDYIVKQQLTAEVLQFAVRTALRQAKLQTQLSTYEVQQTLIRDIALRIRQSLNLQEILSQAVVEVKQLLNCDRTIIYRFLPEGEGVIEVEAIQPGWSPIFGQVIRDPCLENGWIQRFLQGGTTAIQDIQSDNH